MNDTSSAGKDMPPTGKPLWAYAYQMNPPQAEHRMEQVRALLEQENGEAKLGAGTWVARIIVEPQVTHILVVSDSPELNRKLNTRLEVSLRELDTRFSITVPMPLGDRVEGGKK